MPRVSGWSKRIAPALSGGALAAAILIAAPAPAAAADWWVFDGAAWRWAEAGKEPVHSLALFGGEGTERNFSDTLKKLFDFEGSSDRVVAVTAGRRIAWFRRQFSIDAELMYARHYGRETYDEVGMAAYVRWHDFPWNDHLVTSFAVGLGPSYTTIYPQLEVQDNEDDRSKLLNQFNLELTLALPQYPTTSALVRLQHRSGIFGAINGVWDASNFLTIGLKQEF